MDRGLVQTPEGELPGGGKNPGVMATETAITRFDAIADGEAWNLTKCSPQLAAAQHSDIVLHHNSSRRAFE